MVLLPLPPYALTLARLLNAACSSRCCVSPVASSAQGHRRPSPLEGRMATSRGVPPLHCELRRAALRGIVDKEDAKALAVAVRPLKVVHERPAKVANHLDAISPSKA